MTSISFEHFVLLKNLMSPKQIEDVSYKELKETLIKHLKPKPTILAERFKFYKTIQGPSESVANFIAKLRSQASKCGIKEFEQAFLDQFVCGISNKDAQEALLEEEVENLTLETAYQKCVAVGRSKREAQMFSASASSSALVNRVDVKRSTPNKSQLTCKKCGLTGHLANKCRTKCFQCYEEGHIKINCTRPRTPKYQRSVNNRRGRGRGGGEQSSRGRPQRTANAVEDDRGEFYEFEHLDSFDLYHVQGVSSDCTDVFSLNSEIDIKNRTLARNNPHFDLHMETDIELLSNVSDSDDFMLASSLNTLNSDSCKSSKPVIDIIINGIQMSMEIDSGASVSVCSQSVLDKAGVVVDLEPSDMKLKVANGQWEPVIGKALVTVCAKNQKADLTLYVARGNFPSLLGRSWIRVFCGENWFDKLWGE